MFDPSSRRHALGKPYTKEDYDEQFSIRLEKLTEKFKRIESIYSEEGMPDRFTKEIARQQKLLKDAMQRFGKPVVRPDEFGQ